MNASTLPVEAAPLAPVLGAAEVAQLLRYKTAETFLTRRARLEAGGFPPKLPGLNGWSSAAIMRWIETNGRTFEPAVDETPAVHSGALAIEIAALEAEYGQ